MANYTNIPLILPFKFVHNPEIISPHFDDNWQCQQIADFQIKAVYRQKWRKDVTTVLQVESSIAPQDLKVYDTYGFILKSFEWVSVLTAANYSIYETTFDVSDLDDQVVYLYQEISFMDLVLARVWSNPVQVLTSHPNLLVFEYKNSFNKDDVAWKAAGSSFKFMCEAAIQEMEPRITRKSYINQVLDTTVLDGIASRQFSLNIGDAPGVAEWVPDLLNRIFGCDFVSVSGKQGSQGKLYSAKEDAEFEITRVKGYPLVGAKLDIVESKNAQSLQYNDDTEFPVGIVTTYNIETGFFSGPSILPIIIVEENG